MRQALAKKHANRVLLIDDDPNFCELLRRYAETQGVSLDYYNSLQEFGHMRQPKRYDVVILDFDLGEITGCDSAGYISGLFGGIPVVLISGLSEMQIEPIKSSQGINCFVQKSQGCPQIISTALNLVKGSPS
jgi:DNA-binding NtrC family response regulator